MAKQPQARPGPRWHCMVVHARYPAREERVRREAAALVERGYRVDVLCLRGPGERLRAVHDGVDVYRLPVARRPGRGFGAQLLEYLVFFAAAGALLTVMHARRRYDAVQVHSLPDFLVFAALAPRLTGTPVLLDVHDLSPEFFALRAGVGMDHPAVRVVAFQERLSCSFADHVITVTRGWKDTLVARGVPPGKVSVVMNVADGRVFRRRDGAPGRDGRCALLYHGTFSERYGVDLLLEAVARLRDEVPGLTLWLQGDGAICARLEALRDGLGLADRVTINREVRSPAGLAELIRAADVGVVPNRSDVFTDGILPTKLLEYVASGVPVVAARTPAIRACFDDRMVQFFEPGSAASLAEAIRALARDPDRRAALAGAADAFNRTHRWDSTAAAYAGVVDAVRRRRPGTAPPRLEAGQRRSRHGADPQAGLSVRTSTEWRDEAWDEFVMRQPGGGHTQTSLWALVKEPLGWRVARVVAERDGTVVGGAQMLYRRVAPFVAAGYVALGPVLAAGTGGDDAAQVLDALERSARALGVRHLVVQPHGTGEADPAWLGGRCYLAAPVEVAPRATVLLDVSRGPEEIMAGLPSGLRYKIRLSARRGVTVREGGRGDIGTFHRLLEKTALRQGFAAFPRWYFEHMWEVLAPGGHLRLALAECAGDALAAQVVLAFGDTATYKFGAWGGRERKRHPNEGLHFSTIEWAHRHGHRCYDLEGVKLSTARRVLAGEPVGGEQPSVSAFKLRFGGEVVVRPGARVYVPSAALRMVLAGLYPRLGRHRSVRRTLMAVRAHAPAPGRR